MAATSKRLEFLQKLTSSGSRDPFAWYGLAMEYRGLERRDEALATFEALRETQPGLRRDVPDVRPDAREDGQRPTTPKPG